MAVEQFPVEVKKSRLQFHVRSFDARKIKNWIRFEVRKSFSHQKAWESTARP